MAKVDIQFGGEVSCTWGQPLVNALQVYEDIAVQYGLDRPQNAVTLMYDQHSPENALVGLSIRWVKKNYNHTNLQTFFETWGLISTQYNIDRYDMVISDSVV